MTRKKSYLVTGGTGFIGSAVVKQLVRDGYTVRVLDNHSRGALSRLEGFASSVEMVEGDVRDRGTVFRAVQGMDGVFHLAFVNGTEFFYSKPELVLDVGVKGMVNVLDACTEQGVKELILASSSEVYQTPPTVPTAEDVPLSIPDPLNPRYSYGAGKLISEIMAINYGRKFFDRVLVFRPHNVYGPDMGWEHVLPQFILRMKKLCMQNPTGPVAFPIQGTGEDTRAFVYIDDFVAGLMKMVEKGDHLGIYHIGTSEELSIRDVACAVGQYFGREVKVVPGQEAKGGTPRRCPDIRKLQALGYSPDVSFKQGVQLISRWYDENFERAPAHLK